MFSIVFHLYRNSQCTYPCFSRVLLTCTPHNILSKALAAFPQNHHWNNRQQWEKNKFCPNYYHQSSERILAEPWIEQAICCSQVHNATNWAMGLGLEAISPFTTDFSKNLYCRHKNKGLFDRTYHFQQPPLPGFLPFPKRQILDSSKSERDFRRQS